jgi:hypothetical protein
VKELRSPPSVLGRMICNDAPTKAKGTEKNHNRAHRVSGPDLPPGYCPGPPKPISSKITLIIRSSRCGERTVVGVLANQAPSYHARHGHVLGKVLVGFKAVVGPTQKFGRLLSHF